MNSNQNVNNHDTNQTSPIGTALTEAEQAVVKELWWAKECEVVNAGHQVGDRWEFHRRTPEGTCSSAFHTMYPVLHGLMMTSGLYDGPAAKGTMVSCPDGGEVTFRIDRFLWTPGEWDEEG